MHRAKLPSIPLYTGCAKAFATLAHGLEMPQAKALSRRMMHTRTHADRDICTALPPKKGAYPVSLRWRRIETFPEAQLEHAAEYIPTSRRISTYLYVSLRLACCEQERLWNKKTREFCFGPWHLPPRERPATIRRRAGPGSEQE